MGAFYKSEKSGHKTSISSYLLLLTFISSHQNILFQISSIFSKILSGFAYLFTSKPNNLPSIGNKNIDSTVIITPIIAYLIVLIAGLILSSFPPESINNNPPHNIKTIDSIHANNTKSDIANRIKSPKAIDSQKIGLALPLEKATTCVTNIFIFNY
jgi:hypothetical protein